MKKSKGGADLRIVKCDDMTPSIINLIPEGILRDEKIVEAVMHLIEKRNRDDKKDDKKEKKISLKENLSRGEDERTIAQFLALSSNPEAIGQRVDKILEAREQARKLAEKYL